MHDTNFYYNGHFSEEFETYLVSLEGGLHTSPFLSDREIITEKIPFNDVEYTYGITRKPLRKTLTLSCLDGEWTFEKRREIARWLDTDSHKEFYTEDNPSKKYYFMYQGGIDLSYNGELKGYIQVEMVNISPYTYSPFYEQTFNCDTTPYTIDFLNDGDEPLKPILEIKKVGNGDLSIVNISNGGKEFKFTGLLNGENLVVDNYYRDIETDLSLVLRQEDFNLNYLELTRGTNRLTITGKCLLTFKYQYTFKG